MTVTTPATTTTGPAATVTTVSVVRTTSLRRTTVLAGLAASVATTAVAAAAHGAGVSLAVGGDTIPVVGFAQMAFLGAVIGGLLVAVLNRRSEVARLRFLQATAVLTVLSCVPSVAWPDDVATKLVLVATHLLAAVIIVPALARHATR